MESFEEKVRKDSINLSCWQEGQERKPDNQPQGTEETVFENVY